MRSTDTFSGVYVPTDPFRLTARKDGDWAASVRPRTYLREMRLLGYGPDIAHLRACSNRDQLILEALSTVCVQTKPSHLLPMMSVPVAAVLALVMPGAKTRDLVASLERLRTAFMQLPAFAIRTPWTAALRPGFDRPLKTKPAPLEGEEPFVRTTPLPTRKTHGAARAGKPVEPQVYYAHAQEVVAAAREEPFRTLVGVEPAPYPMASELATTDGPFVFAPLLRYAVVGKELVFELSPILRLVLRSHRAGKNATPGYRRYLRLDIDRLATMSSGYSIALWRHLIERAGHSALPDTYSLELSWEQVAEIVSLRMQKSGSARGQVEYVLQAARRDFERACDSDRTLVDLRWKDDAGKFLNAVEVTLRTALPPLRRLPSRRLQSAEPTGFRRLASDMKEQAKLSSPDLQFVARPDEPRYRVTLSTWTKVAGLLRLPSLSVVHVSEAFDLALDEMLRMADAGFEPYGERFATSPARGQALWDLIEGEGVQRAAVLFAIDEHRHPDLTHPANASYHRMVRTVGWAETDRMERLKASRLPKGNDGMTPLPVLVERVQPERWSDAMMDEWMWSRHAAKEAGQTSDDPRRPPIIFTPESMVLLHEQLHRDHARKQAVLALNTSERNELKAKHRARVLDARNARRRDRYAFWKKLAGIHYDTPMSHLHEFWLGDEDDDDLIEVYVSDRIVVPAQSDSGDIVIDDGPDYDPFAGVEPTDPSIIPF